MIGSFFKKRRRIVLLLAGCVLTGLLLIFLWPEAEPSYKGKSLSQWLAIYTQPEHGESVRQQEAANAIRAIGTNALPILLKRLQYEPGRMHYLTSHVLDRLPATVSGSPAAEGLLGRGYNRSGAAYVGFMLLGEDASPAIPELIRIMNRTNSPFSARQATYVLALIGPKAISAVAGALNDPAQLNRDLLVAFVDSIANSVNGPEPFAVLARCVGDNDRKVAELATTALGNAPLYPEIVVPALAQALRSPNRRLRLESANALANFGPEAHSAIPQLQQALNDPDRQVRFAASNAIVRISPQPVPKSGSEN